MKISIKFLLLAVLTAILLSACLPKIGDHMIVKKDQITLVANWNAISYIKPTACVLTKGVEVEVVDLSILIQGSSDHEPIVQVQTLDKSCTGWGFPDQFKRIKEDK